MSRRVQYLDGAGLRGDGRRPGEGRKPEIALGSIPGTDGSCVFKSGATVVSASVFGPRHAPFRAEARADEATFSCTVAFSATAGDRRRQVRRNARQTDEVAALVTQALESTLILTNYPNAAIMVALEVNQADGNELASCISAASLALADAGIAMTDLVAGCNAGIIDNVGMCDLTQVEVRSGCPVLHLAVLAHDPAAIVAMSMDSRISDAGVDDMYTHATNGCVDVAAEMQRALKSEVTQRVVQRGTAGFVQMPR
jgi:exosome complex component RRP41